MHIKLNESSYSSHPDLFSVTILPDVFMDIVEIKDGLQEVVTYNPPGPTQPGFLKKVHIYFCKSLYCNTNYRCDEYQSTHESGCLTLFEKDSWLPIFFLLSVSA